MFDTAATADTAIQSVLQAVSEAGGKVSGLRLRTDNGSQYLSCKFREAIQALGDPARVHLEAHARTERTRRVFPRNAQTGVCMYVCMYGPMSLSGSKTPKWCWPERLQTTTTTGYTRLWGMSLPMSLLAKWRAGTNEG